MASNKRTIYLGLDYSNFTGGVSEVNRKMQLLDAEFKLAQEQAKNYGNETDRVGTKIDYLKQKIILQNQKVEAAKKAYDAAMSSQNASAKTIDALDKKLLQERTSLEKLNGALKEEEENQNRVNKETESFGDAIRDIASDLGLNVSPAVEKLASKFDGLDKSVGFAIVGIAALGSKLVSCSKDFADYSDDVLTMSSTTGIATDELQKFMYASELVDVSVDTMSGAMTRMIRNMDDAKNGTGEAKEAFQELGIKITDSTGHLKDSNAIFYEVIDRLGKMKNETERDAAAMNIFGKSARELNPLIEAGSKRLKELGEEAESTGKILSDEELAEGGAYKDALDRLDDASEKLSYKLGEVLAPILTTVADIVSSINPDVLKVIILMTSAATIAGALAKAYTSMAAAATIGAAAQTAFGASAGMSLGPLLAIAAVIIVIVGLISLLTKGTNEANAALSEAEDQAKRLGDITGQAQTNTYNAGQHASGTTNFAGGRTWVGEAGPELLTLPGGTAITPANEVGRTEHNVFNITIDAKNVRDFQRVVELAEGQKMALRRI